MIPFMSHTYHKIYQSYKVLVSSRYCLHFSFSFLRVGRRTFLRVSFFLDLNKSTYFYAVSNCFVSIMFFSSCLLTNDTRKLDFVSRSENISRVLLSSSYTLAKDSRSLLWTAFLVATPVAPPTPTPATAAPTTKGVAAPPVKKMAAPQRRP